MRLRGPLPQLCNPSQMWGAAAQRHAPHPATLPPPPPASAAGLPGERCCQSPCPTSLPAPHADASLSPLSIHLYPQPQAPSAQVMDFLFEKWKLYGDQCLHNLSLLPPPTGEPRLRPECSPPNPHPPFTGEEIEP